MTTAFPSSSFVIKELTGDQRTVILTGRGLPYRPLTLETKQRVQLTWLPGSPEATSTVLGSQEDPTQINGYWKDKFIDTTVGDVNQSTTAGFSPPIKLNGSSVDTVLDAADLFDSLVRLGQVLEVTWLNQKRHGYMTSFLKKFHNQHDLEWTIQFEWVSRGEVTGPVVFAAGNSLAGTVSMMRAAFNGIDGISVNLSLNIGLVDSLVNFVNLIQESLLNLEDTIANFAFSILAPVYAVKGMLATLNSIVVDADLMIGVLSNQTADALDFGNSTDQDTIESVTPNQKLSYAFYREQMRSWARAMQRLAVEQRQALIQQVAVLSSEVLAIFVARDGQDLRDVSEQYYQTPFHWRQIMVFNGMVTAELEAGQQVLVPKIVLPDQTQAGV